MLQFRREYGILFSTPKTTRKGAFSPTGLYRGVAATPEGQPVFVAVNAEAWGEGISTVDGAPDLLPDRKAGDRYEFVSAGTITGIIREYLTVGDDGRSE